MTFVEYLARKLELKEKTAKAVAQSLLARKPSGDTEKVSATKNKF